jgi:hypothetical protein
MFPTKKPRNFSRDFRLRVVERVATGEDDRDVDLLPVHAEVQRRPGARML